MFGGFASIAGTVRLRTSGADPARLALPAAPWRPVRQWPYGLRLLDVAGAFSARGGAPLDVTLPFRVTGDGLDGYYRLTASGGALTCEPAADGGPVFTGRGLALAYAGVQSCANLRFAGLLSGPDTDDACGTRCSAAASSTSGTTTDRRPHGTDSRSSGRRAGVRPACPR